MTHEERLRLIYRPFPEVRRIASSAMPWAGVLLGDQFIDWEEWAMQTLRIRGISTPGTFNRPFIHNHSVVVGGPFHFSDYKTERYGHLNVVSDVEQEILDEIEAADGFEVVDEEDV